MGLQNEMLGEVIILVAVSFACDTSTDNQMYEMLNKATRFQNFPLKNSSEVVWVAISSPAEFIAAFRAREWLQDRLRGSLILQCTSHAPGDSKMLYKAMSVAQRQQWHGDCSPAALNNGSPPSLAVQGHL